MLFNLEEDAIGTLGLTNLPALRNFVGFANMGANDQSYAERHIRKHSLTAVKASLEQVNVGGNPTLKRWSAKTGRRATSKLP